MTDLARPAGQRGLTLLELVLASTLLAILAASAMPLYQVTVRREREVELRRALREVRRALDDFHRSYVASGGSLSQGGSSTAGIGAPGQASQPPGMPITPGQVGPGSARNRPGGAPGAPAQPGTAAPGMGGPNGDIPLIDASQFDPIDSKGYPPDLEILIEGVQAFGGGSDDEDKVKFLRRIPIDPMLPRDQLDDSDKNFGWGVRCYQDEPKSTVWCRKNVWDVYSKNRAVSLDGKTRYNEW